MGRRAQLGRAGQRRQPHPEGPRRPLDRLARPRAAGSGCGSTDPARRGAQRARVRDGGPARGPRPPVLRGLREPDPLAPLPQLRDQLRSRIPTAGTAYVAANRRFRDAVLEHLRARRHGVDPRLPPDAAAAAASATSRPRPGSGFFLHIPFPASETFRILPHRDEVLRGLLGADLVAFQTHLDLQHFRSSPAARPGPAQPAGPGRSRRAARPGWRRFPSASPPTSSRAYIESDPKTQRRLRGAAHAVPRTAASSSASTASTTRRGFPSACARSASCCSARRTCAARSCSSRWRCPRAKRIPRVRPPAPRGERAWWARSTASSARRNGRPSSTSAARISRARAGGAVRGGGRRLGHAAARRDEPRRQGVRGLPSARRRRARPQRVRGGGGGDGRGLPREPLRRGARGRGPGARTGPARGGAAGAHADAPPPRPPQQRLPLERAIPLPPRGGRAGPAGRTSRASGRAARGRGPGVVPRLAQPAHPPRLRRHPRPLRAASPRRGAAAARGRSRRRASPPPPASPPPSCPAGRAPTSTPGSATCRTCG